MSEQHERDYQMISVAKKMSDLFDELVFTHGFGREWAKEITASYFKGGYK